MAFTPTAIQAEGLMDVGGVNDLSHIVCDQGTAWTLRGMLRLFWGLAKYRRQLLPVDIAHTSKSAAKFRYRSVHPASFSRGFFSKMIQ